MYEQPTSPEKEITREQIIEALKLGIDRPEVLQLLTEWTQQQETRAKRPEDNINVDRVRGHVYWEAGYTEAALDSFEAAWVAAQQGGMMQLSEESAQEVEDLKT